LGWAGGPSEQQQPAAKRPSSPRREAARPGPRSRPLRPQDPAK